MAINDNTSYELFGYQVKDLATKIKSKAEAASLAPVATSGLYSDLTGRPVIPAVYNGTLTIQQNGTTVDTFTANSVTNKTVNIETITAETVAPAEEVGAITASMIDWSTIVMKGTWTTPATGSVGSYVQSSAIDVSAFGFSSADDYVVNIVSRGGASNGWAAGFTISEKTATSFKVTQWNCHFAGGTIGAGNIVDWAVFRVA